MREGARCERLFRSLRDSRASGIALVAGLLVMWEASVRTGIAVSDNWPAFSAVLVSFVTGVASGELPAVMLSTLLRMAEGYAVGVALGVGVGALMAVIRPARAVLEPTVELLRPIPATAVIPPLIFIFGVDGALKVFMVAFATFFPVLANTMTGIQAVERVHLDVARTFSIPPFRTFLRVTFPSSLPYILAGMRTALGLAIVVTIVAEMIAGSSGIGHYLIMMQFALRPADMYAGIILLAAVGYLLNYAFVWWEARVIHWSRVREKMANAS